MSKKIEYEEFLRRSHERHGEKFTYDEKTREFYNGSHSIVPIVCPVHGEMWVEARSHWKYDCEKCSYAVRGKMYGSSTEDFIEKARNVHGDKYDYSNVSYLKAHDKVNIICPIHGSFSQTPNYHLNGKGCPYCKESHLERRLCLYLASKGIIFEKFKHFEWLGKQELDFYLPKHKIGIECQGKQHFKLGGWSPKFDFEKMYVLDKKKNDLCFANGLKLLYTIDKIFFKKALEFDLYSENNLFYNFNDLVEEINKVES